MDKLLIFIIVFGAVYLFYLFFVIFNKKKIDKIFDTNQAKLILLPYKLDVSRIDKKCFAHVLSLFNSFIVACTFTISEFFDNYVLKLFICFVTLTILIFIVYRLIGFMYKKREGR